MHFLKSSIRKVSLLASDIQNANIMCYNNFAYPFLCIVLRLYYFTYKSYLFNIVATPGTQHDYGCIVISIGYALCIWNSHVLKLRKSSPDFANENKLFVTQQANRKTIIHRQPSGYFCQTLLQHPCIEMAYVYKSYSGNSGTHICSRFPSFPLVHI